jgi:hypothetical protein
MKGGKVFREMSKEVVNMRVGFGEKENDWAARGGTLS